MTPTPTPTEQDLRALFRAHEHLADSDRPAELAWAARAQQRRQQRARRLTGLAALGVAATVGGVLAVSWTGDEPPAPRPAARVVPTDLPPDLRDRAVLVLDRFEDSDRGRLSIVAAMPLLTQVGDWEPRLGNGAKLAFSRLLIEAATTLPDEVPAPGEATWSSGAKQTFPLISARSALAQATAGSLPCETTSPSPGGTNRAEAPGVTDSAGCSPLLVTGASLTSTSLQTSRGAASVPAWEFILAGTSVRLRYVAVAPERLTTTPPLTEVFGPFVTEVKAATVSADGRQVTVQIAGSGPTSIGGCGADYRADAVESATAVVVIAQGLPNPAASSDQVCTSQLYLRTVTATLTTPLGDRVVLDPRYGQPVPRNG